MASEKKKKRVTPSRAKRAGEQQFFDVGKVGRVTGITLADTGLRDEHGLEPMDHIFSSPISPQRRDNSSEARMQESSGPDLDATLTSRKTPHMLPPRTSTPRHTNIGSPIRRSTGRPKSQRATDVVELNGSPTRPQTQPANRTLDFNHEKVVSSIEQSPFRPRHALRRSTGARRTNVFASPQAHRAEAEVDEAVDQRTEDQLGDNINDERVEDDGLLVGADDDYAGPGFPDTEMESTLDNEIEAQSIEPRRSSQRRSGNSLEGSELQGSSPRRQSNRKRGRASFESRSAIDQDASTIGAEEQQHAHKRHRSNDHESDGNTAIDPSLVASGDDQDADTGMENVVEQDISEQQALAADSGTQKPKGRRGRPPKGRNTDGTVKASQTSIPINDEVRQSQRNNRLGSVGPTSKFNLRAMTPSEDAGMVTRAGRLSRQPFKYWANEKPIYKNGEVDAIIRADEIEASARRKKRRSRKKIKKGTGTTRQADIDESETESIMADEWEVDVGVISGDVANWDPETQTGDPNDLVHEDLAHAEPSLEKRHVAAGSNFRYSKILTLPFFGIGVVEVPPGGIKRTKNCRKNQLAFFMHKGKVMVEVNPPGDGATNQFAISKGGVWLVPRGNEYSITNESTTTEAVIFFCQGSEVPTASS